MHPKNTAPLCAVLGISNSNINVISFIDGSEKTVSRVQVEENSKEESDGHINAHSTIFGTE